MHVGEAPAITKDEQLQRYQAKRPLRPPTTTIEHNQLLLFCKEVEIILQTVDDNEYQAAVIILKPPSDKFERAVVFPSAGTVVGMLADHKTALIQTDQGSNAPEFVEKAIDIFCNATFIIAVGAGYAFDRSKYNPGDVLVSKQIGNLRNLEFAPNGEIIDRAGETIDVVNDLKSVFCMDLKFEEDFIASKNGRTSSVYHGRYISFPALLQNKDMCDKFHRALPGVIGGDMEGGELLRFQKNRNRIEGIIVIKGVANYADGSAGGKEWQFTAALAALKYTEEKLYYYQRNVAGKLPIGFY